jgi:c-di-GMP-binding flagellar brake protein YcgR
MQYKKYFKPGQRVILKTLASTALSDSNESFTTFLVRCEKDLFELSLPYRQHPQEIPFEVETDFEVLSEAFGLGLRFMGRITDRAAQNVLRLRADGNLELYYRRRHRRVTASVGVLYSRAKGGLRSARENWNKTVKVLEGGKGLSQLPPFSTCRVNLSAGGVRFPVKMPVEVADLFLVFLDIEDGQSPICVLSEVVWVDTSAKEDTRVAGIRFINILDSDQKRIERFVRDQTPAGEDPSEEDDGPKID